MSLKLRDLIRNVRACRTQAEERGLIAKECAEIRTSFRNKDEEHLRHRNVAKLLYIHMLGYPTHFGQMEAMKLLATPRFAEKRIGYLALIMLFDENQDLLMLATNSMKNDLHSANPYICGLALTAIGNIASPAIARDLSLDIIETMTNTNNNHYIRKKAALTAIRVIRRVPEIVEDFVQPAYDLLTDKHNNVQMCGLQLMLQVVKLAPHLSIPTYRALVPRLYTILRSTWSMSYNVEYDVMGINDPFLQVAVLRFLRTLCQTTFTIKRTALFDTFDDEDEDMSKYPGTISIVDGANGDEKVVTIEKMDDGALEKINELLALVIANIDNTKIPGAAIHYEAILTTLTVSTDQNLRINSIIQLGKFLQSRDNNIRYISLNTMYQVAQQQLLVVSNANNQQKQTTTTTGGKTNNNNNNNNGNNNNPMANMQLRELKLLHSNALSNLEVIQRYRNIIVAYLKDNDPSIRKRALSLIYALVTEKNVRPLVRELLMYLSIPTSSAVALSKKDDKLQYRAPSTILALLDKKENDENNNNNNTNGNNNSTDSTNLAKKAFNDVNTHWTNIPGLVSTHLPYAGGSSEAFRNQATAQASSLFTSSTNYEFKCDLTQKIYFIIYQYAPNIVWQIYSMISLLSTDNEYINENVYFEFVTLLQNYSKLPQYQQQLANGVLSYKDPHTGNAIKLTKQHIDAFIVYELFYNIVSFAHIIDRIKYPHLIQSLLFFLSTHFHYLTTPQGFVLAQAVSIFLQQDSQAHAPKQNAANQAATAGGAAPTPPPPQQLYEPTINYNNKSYYTNPVQYHEVTKLLTHIVNHKNTTEQTKQLGLTCVMRLVLLLQKEINKLKTTTTNNNNNTAERLTNAQTAVNALETILSLYRCHINVDLQQRASEYLLLSRGELGVSHKIIFPIVSYNRTNLDFDNDDEQQGNEMPSSAATSPTNNNNTNNTQQLDVFANLGGEGSSNNNIANDGTAQQQQQQNNNNTTTSTSGGLDILNDLLAPTPAAPVAAVPVVQQQQAPVSTNPFDLLSGGFNTSTSTPQQQQQQTTPQPTTTTTNAAPVFDLMSDLLSSPTKPTQQPQQSQQPTDLLSAMNNLSLTPSPQQPQQPQQPQNDPLDVLGGADPFGGLMASPTASTNNNNNNNTNNNSNTNSNTSSNNTSGGAFDMLDFGLTPTSAPPATTPAGNNDDDDDFESAIDPVQNTPQNVNKTITVYQQDNIHITMQYTTAINTPEQNNVTYNILVNIQTTATNMNLNNFDFKVAIKAPLQKTIKLPSSRQLTATQNITQELVVVNTATAALDQTTFRCMFVSVDQNGAAFSSKPFPVSM